MESVFKEHVAFSLFALSWYGFILIHLDNVFLTEDNYAQTILVSLSYSSV